MYAFADLMAILQNHEDDPLTGQPHMSTVVINGHEASNHSLLQRIATWLTYFGAVSGLSDGGLIVFRFFGGNTLTWKLLQKISGLMALSSRKCITGDDSHAVVPSSNPMTIINMPQEVPVRGRKSEAKRSRRGRRTRQARLCAIDLREQQPLWN